MELPTGTKLLQQVHSEIYQNLNLPQTSGVNILGTRKGLNSFLLQMKSQMKINSMQFFLHIIKPSTSVQLWNLFFPAALVLKTLKELIEIKNFHFNLIWSEVQLYVYKYTTNSLHKYDMWMNP